MKINTLLSSLHIIAAVAVMSIAMPAIAAPKAAKTESSPAASPAAKEEAKPFPFKNTVVGVDKAKRTVTIGKNKVHQVHVLPETKISKGEETPATFEEIIIGEEIRGSVRKRADGEYEAISIKIGPKVPVSPVAASPTPKAGSKKQ